jgi:hypothetical protein
MARSRERADPDVRIVVTLDDDGHVEVYADRHAQVLLIDRSDPQARECAEYRTLRIADGAGGTNTHTGAFYWKEIGVDPRFVARAMDVAGRDPFATAQATVQRARPHRPLEERQPRRSRRGP